MAEKTLNTRIKLKYDTLANWTKNDPVLLKGEIALVEVPNATDPIHNAPSIVYKVGADGVKKFSELSYGSALSADVYTWAKAATKPTYTASEVGVNETTFPGLKKTGTITGITMNGASKGTSGVVDLGTVITSHQDISGKQNVAISVDGITAKTVEAALKELAGNIASKYTKPATGIPAAHLADSVQTSLGKADSALQPAALNNYATKSDVDTKISTHNSSTSAHADIRKKITALEGQVGGLGNALHFVGVGTLANRPQVSASKQGDVYLVNEGEKNGIEYVFDGTAWQEFGSPEHITGAQADAKISTAIQALDATITGAAAGKTLKTLTETDGKIDATFQDIAITQGQVSGLATALAGKKNTQTAITDTEVANSYVAAVSQNAQGVITVKRTALPAGASKTGTVTSVSADTGLKITGNTNVNPKVAFDDAVTFILDCGSSSNI